MTLTIAIYVAPKYRRQIIYGKLKVEVGKILRDLCEKRNRNNTCRVLHRPYTHVG
jgi:transposase, IS200 family (fragment)